jgi:hypothetical protein
VILPDKGVSFVELVNIIENQVLNLYSFSDIFRRLYVSHVAVGHFLFLLVGGQCSRKPVYSDMLSVKAKFKAMVSSVVSKNGSPHDIFAANWFYMMADFLIGLYDNCLLPEVSSRDDFSLTGNRVEAFNRVDKLVRDKIEILELITVDREMFRLDWNNGGIDCYKKILGIMFDLGNVSYNSNTSISGHNDVILSLEKKFGDEKMRVIELLKKDSESKSDLIMLRSEINNLKVAQRKVKDEANRICANYAHDVDELILNLPKLYSEIRNKLNIPTINDTPQDSDISTKYPSSHTKFGYYSG